MTNSYIAYYTPGPKWLKGKPLKDQPLQSHVEYLVGLHRTGRVIMGGPFGDGSGGLVIFTADDIVDVNEAVSCDPAVAEGVLVASVKHWTRIV